MYAEQTARAADLAEWIVEEVSRADRDWPAIERQAMELADLAAAGAGRRRDLLAVPDHGGGDLAVALAPMSSPEPA